MGQVEEAVGSRPNGPDYGPQIRFSRSLANPIQGGLNVHWRQVNQVGEVIAGQVRFREQHDSAAFRGGGSNVMEGAFDVSFQGLGPVQLHTGDLQCLVHRTDTVRIVNCPEGGVARRPFLIPERGLA